MSTASETRLIDLLTYRSYAANREISPEITPERWGLIFDNWEAMEAKYQQEKELQPCMDSSR